MGCWKDMERGGDLGTLLTMVMVTMMDEGERWRGMCAQFAKRTQITGSPRNYGFMLCYERAELLFTQVLFVRVCVYMCAQPCVLGSS